MLFLLQLFENYIFVLILTLAITPPSFIVGLAYYEIGAKTINVVIPATIPNNAALVIATKVVCMKYYVNQICYDTTVNIVGPGSNHIKTIIWASYARLLQFSSNSVIKRVSYVGYSKYAIRKIAQKEFDKNKDVVYSAYKAPSDIIIYYRGKYYILTEQ